MGLSRVKGALGEVKVLDLLSAHNPGIKFERVPGSGNGKIKGDIHIPESKGIFCIEVKNYAESFFNDTILTNKSNKFVAWWNKLILEAKRENKEPLLFFRYNRSKIFVATSRLPTTLKSYIYIESLKCYTMVAEEWLKTENPKFIH